MSSAHESTPRAPRFLIVTRILWRPSGTSQWSEGMSLNASRTGVLFETQLNLVVVPGAEVELIFAFSWEADAPVDMADVRCTGRIVRTGTTSSDGRGAVLAAAIERYSFMPLS